jgi:CheY-like chemotaxis protein
VENLPSAPLVLVVDGHPDCREACATFLALAGFSVEQSDNGRDALELAIAVLPDVIVTDLVLRGIDGWELVWRLKNHPRTARIPVIVFSALTFPGCRERASKAGCDHFLSKPGLPEDLVAAIQRLVPGAVPAGPARR